MSTVVLAGGDHPLGYIFVGKCAQDRAPSNFNGHGREKLDRV
jgi:hypothetical protein